MSLPIWTNLSPKLVSVLRDSTVLLMHLSFELKVCAHMCADIAIEEKFFCQALAAAFTCIVDLYESENDKKEVPDPALTREYPKLRKKIRHLLVSTSSCFWS